MYKASLRRALAIGTGARPVQSPLTKAHLDDLKFKPIHVGQLGPPRPSPAETRDGTTVTGRLLVRNGAVVQRGPFGSLWLRLGCVGREVPSPEVMLSLLDTLLSAQALAELPGAVYVALPESGIDAPHIRGLLDGRFSFHHYRKPEEEGDHISRTGGGEFVYYRWPDGVEQEDRVPAYATAIEGVGALLLSPDEQAILLVWEYGVWKQPTGAVDKGEGKLRAIKREVFEEVGLDLDDSFAPLYLGGYQTCRSRDQQVNDNFSIFAVRVLPGTVCIDGSEIVEARWFRINELLSISSSEGVAKMNAMGGKVPLDGDRSKARNLISTGVLASVVHYVRGRGVSCTEALRPERSPDSVQLAIGAFDGAVSK